LSNKLIWRIYPRWADSTPKADRKATFLGTVLATTQQEAEEAANTGQWRLKDAALDSYKGEFRAQN
jgi:hypothetical protein